MGVLSNLEPASVFYYFEEICSIPHTSHHEKALSDYCVQFAKAHGLACRQDEMGNVLIKAPATPGYEKEPGLILQGHLDMVGDKTADCPLDLEKDAIHPVVDGGYVCAEGTTLGGDDGIAVAYALAVLDAKDIPHPALEVVLTVCEEVGLLGAWDMEATKPAYSVLKNNLLYAMIFLMLLRCDIRKIIKLGPKMLGGFFAASVSISLAFIATFAIMKGPLGSEAWKALGALCGSWMGGSGNMIAVQAALDIGEADMAYALVVDSIDYSIWVMFLLWAINLAPKFNKWVKADTTTLDEVSRRLEEDAKGNEDKASFVNLIFLLGLALVISAFGQDIGAALNGAMPFLDKATWTVLLITLSGLIGAVTPVGRMAGSTELSNLLLYSVVALLASRASFLELTDAPAWILAGFMILAIHGIILVLLAKIFHLDMFTCGVASLANIGGSASAPILAGAYSGALVPVGVLMALMGYVIGTAGGLITANIMSLLA